MDAFLKKLESVGTSWGTFNLRPAYEAGMATGDFSELNKVWDETIGKSTRLTEIMPDFAARLAAVAKAATDAAQAIDPAIQAEIDGFKELRDAIQGGVSPIDTMYDKFLKTGVVTDVLAGKIQELGGNVEAFQNYADLSAGFAPLKKQLDFIGSLAQGIQGLAPELDPIRQLLSGTMSPDVMDALTGAGIDPQKLSGLTGMIGLESNWDPVVKTLQDAGKLSPALRQALMQYGGGAGQTAVGRFDQGFYTITSSLLSATKAAMDAAYKGQITDTLTYLGSMQRKTADAITELRASISDAAADVVDELDKIFAKISSPAAPVTMGAPDVIPGGSEDANPTGTPENPAAAGAYIDLRGATIFGYDEIARRVAEAQAINARRTGILAVV